jgi:hypothetical protein
MSGRRRDIADPRALEAYIRSGLLPRFSQRLRTIEDDLAEHRMRLADAYAETQRACLGDAPLFEERWRAAAHAWDFDAVNELILQHNEYYPIERNLPVNPRTGDYVTPAGRPYWRVPAGPEWILEQFPAVLVA